MSFDGGPRIVRRPFFPEFSFSLAAPEQLLFFSFPIQPKVWSAAPNLSLLYSFKKKVFLRKVKSFSLEILQAALFFLHVPQCCSLICPFFRGFLFLRSFLEKKRRKMVTVFNLLFFFALFYRMDRPTVSQFWSFIICLTAFMNYSRFADLLILRL